MSKEYTGSEFDDIRSRVDAAERLAATRQQTGKMFMNALCSAIEGDNSKHAKQVACVVRNRLKGGSLAKEPSKVVDWIESFRE